MIEFLKGIFFSRTCLLCGENLTESKEQIFCPKCRLEYEKLKRRPCDICGKPHGICSCLPTKLAGKVERAIHLFAYDEEISKTIIFTMKRRRLAPLFSFLGKELASRLDVTAQTEITFAPRKPKSVREYGFDQAKCLAEEIGKSLELPVVRLFRHAHHSALQKELGAEERAENAEKSYTLCRLKEKKQGNLIIVDDVMTTGSTMSKLVELAREAGYEKITVVCVAHTVWKGKDHEREAFEMSSETEI